MSPFPRLVLFLALLSAGVVSCSGAKSTSTPSSTEQSGKLTPGAARTLRAATILGGALVESGRPFTPEEQYRIGTAVADALYARYPRVAAHPRRAYAVEIAHQLAARSGAGPVFRPDGGKDWTLEVVDCPKILACSAPSGFLFVSRGALDALVSEDELAALLAHETAHVVRGHGLAMIRKRAMVEVPGRVFAVLAPESAEQLKQFAGENVEQQLRGYGRDLELDADRAGTRLSAAAGYDASAMLALLERLRVEQGEPGPDDSHPGYDLRVQAVRETLAELKTARPAKAGR